MGRAIVSSVKSSDLVKDRRGRIVRAAIAVFLEKSFHTATVSDVAARVGLSQGAVYNYVRSKDDILYLICVEAVEAYSAAVAEALQGVTGPRERLLAAVRATVAAMHEHKDSTLVVYREAHLLGGESIRALLGAAGSFTATIQQLIDEAVAADVMPPCNAAFAANVVTYLPTIIANRDWNMRRTVPRDEMISGVTQFLLAGLGLQAEDDA